MCSVLLNEHGAGPRVSRMLGAVGFRRACKKARPVVDAFGFYVTALASSAALAWLLAHRPAGLLSIIKVYLHLYVLHVALL